eukprot:c25790_g1_i1.p1 GENE.c25790_g1_i1~~c25790_g1_i1.p1  ORF type:complete len:1307 (+),score=373.65 c25790_g1_i1:52-3921(+)
MRRVFVVLGTLLFLFGFSTHAFKTSCDWLDALQGDVTTMQNAQEVMTNVWMSLSASDTCEFDSPSFSVDVSKPGGAEAEALQQEELKSASKHLYAIQDLEGGSKIWRVSNMFWLFLKPTDGVPVSLRTARFIILTKSEPNDVATNEFSIDLEDCTQPLPLLLKNSANPSVRCMRLSLYPDTCQHALSVASVEGSSDFVFDIGFKERESESQEFSTCDFSSSKQSTVMFSNRPIGTDEDDLTWFQILDMNGENRGTVPFSVPEHRMFDWAFRTSRTKQFQITYLDAPEFPTSKAVPVPAPNTSVDAELTRESSIAKFVEKQSSKALLTDLDLGRVLDPEPDQPRVVLWEPPGDAMCSIVDSGFPRRDLSTKPHWVNMELRSGFVPNALRLPCIRFRRSHSASQIEYVFPSEQCSAVKSLLEASIPEGQVPPPQKSFTVLHVVILPLAQAALDAYHQASSSSTPPTTTSTTALSSNEAPPAATSRIVSTKVEMLSPQEKLELCAHTMESSTPAEFILVLGLQTKAGVWHNAMPMLDARIGDPQSWMWRGDAWGDINIRFDNNGATQLFESDSCKQGLGNQPFPVDLISRNPFQEFQCMRIFGKSDTNCRKALGLGKERRMVTFEASLATVVTDTQTGPQCVYMPPFVVTFVDTDHYVDESGVATSDRLESVRCPAEKAQLVVVSGSNAPMPLQWRWHSDANGRLEIVFPTLVTWEEPKKRVWERFVSVSATDPNGQCPVQKSDTFPPPEMFDSDVIGSFLEKTESDKSSKKDHIEGVVNVNKAEEEADKLQHDKKADEDDDNASEKGLMEALPPNEVYKCLKLRKADYFPAKTAEYRQAMMIEQMRDMALDPKGAERHDEIQALMVQFERYADMKRAVTEQLKSSTYRNAVTKESGSEFDNFAAGFTSHFARIDELPAGHPTIERGKVIHSEGMVAKCVFVSNIRNKYSGLLGQSAVPVIARYSSAVSHDAKGIIPGWALKFFRDAPAPNSDLLMYNSFKIKKDCNIFAYPVSNIPEWKPTSHTTSLTEIDNSMQFVLQRGQALRRTKDAAHHGTRFPMRLGISHLFFTDEQAFETLIRENEFKAATTADSKASDTRDTKQLPHLLPAEFVQKAVFPDQLVFIPHRVAVSLAQVALKKLNNANACENQKAAMTTQLTSLPARTPLFEVYAVPSAPLKISLSEFVPMIDQHIGTVYLQEPFFASWYADVAVHFKHELYESDTQHPDHNKGFNMPSVYSETDTFESEVAVKAADQNSAIKQQMAQAQVANPTAEEWAEMKPYEASPDLNTLDS